MYIAQAGDEAESGQAESARSGAAGAADGAYLGDDDIDDWDADDADHFTCSISLEIMQDPVSKIGQSHGGVPCARISSRLMPCVRGHCPQFNVRVRLCVRMAWRVVQPLCIRFPADGRVWSGIFRGWIFLRKEVDNGLGSVTHWQRAHHRENKGCQSQNIRGSASYPDTQPQSETSHQVVASAQAEAAGRTRGQCKLVNTRACGSCSWVFSQLEHFAGQCRSSVDYHGSNTSTAHDSQVLVECVQ